MVGSRTSWARGPEGASARTSRAKGGRCPESSASLLPASGWVGGCWAGGGVMGGGVRDAGRHSPSAAAAPAGLRERRPPPTAPGTKRRRHLPSLPVMRTSGSVATPAASVSSSRPASSCSSPPDLLASNGCWPCAVCARVVRWTYRGVGWGVQGGCTRVWVGRSGGKGGGGQQREAGGAPPGCAAARGAPVPRRRGAPQEAAHPLPCRPPRSAARHGFEGQDVHTRRGGGDCVPPAPKPIPPNPTQPPAALLRTSSCSLGGCSAWRSPVVVSTSSTRIAAPHAARSRSLVRYLCGWVGWLRENDRQQHPAAAAVPPPLTLEQSRGGTAASGTRGKARSVCPRTPRSGTRAQTSAPGRVGAPPRGARARGGAAARGVAAAPSPLSSPPDSSPRVARSSRAAPLAPSHSISSGWQLNSRMRARTYSCTTRGASRRGGVGGGWRARVALATPPPPAPPHLERPLRAPLQLGGDAQQRCSAALGLGHRFQGSRVSSLQTLQPVGAGGLCSAWLLQQRGERGWWPPGRQWATFSRQLLPPPHAAPRPLLRAHALPSLHLTPSLSGTVHWQVGAHEKE